MNGIAAEYNRLQREKEEREQAEREKRREESEKAYQERVRASDEPWIGMAEADIGYTRLGPYARFDTMRELVQEKESKVYRQPQFVYRTVSHFDFYKNGRIYLEVFCTDGTVDELAKYENGKVYYTYSSALSTYRKAWNNRARVPMTGFYDAGDYASEEDYYEDHADDLEGPDDAPDWL